MTSRILRHVVGIDVRGGPSRSWPAERSGCADANAAGSNGPHDGVQQCGVDGHEMAWPGRVGDADEVTKEIRDVSRPHTTRRRRHWPNCATSFAETAPGPSRTTGLDAAMDGSWRGCDARAALVDVPERVRQHAAIENSPLRGDDERRQAREGSRAEVTVPDRRPMSCGHDDGRAALVTGRSGCGASAACRSGDER